MINKYFNLVKSIVHDIEPSMINVPITDTHIDSMDLLTIRVELENMIGKQIPDPQWVRFNTLNEIFEFCETQNNAIQKKLLIRGVYKYNKINMPQMALQALSENWFLKKWEIYTGIYCVMG